MTTTVFRGGTVIDPSTASSRPADVTVTDERIASLDARPSGSPHDEATVVDATGCFLAPGLVEAHAHPYNLPDPTGALRLMLTYGITGVRQMAGTDQLLRNRATVDAAADVPELLALPGAVLTTANAGTPEQARAEVRRQAGLGADFIKVAMVSASVLTDIQEEAARVGLPVVGHLPPGVDAVAAARQGLRAVEHLGPGTGLLSHCLADGATVRHDAAAQPVPGPPDAAVLRLPGIAQLWERLIGAVVRRLLVNPANSASPTAVAELRTAVDGFDERLARELADALVQAGTWQVPTLVRELTQYRCDDPRFAADGDLRFVSASTHRLWTAAATRFARLDAATRRTFADAYDVLLLLVAVFDRAGVPMLTGSDSCGAAWLVAGAALHHEFDELARAGLGAARILRMATSDAARFLGRADLGAVEPGRRAELVIFGSDPLTDVAHLHDVVGVVRAGRHLDRAALAAIRHQVATDRPVG